MTLKSQIADDVLGVFFNTDDMASFATYYPKNGTPKQVLFIDFVSPRRTDTEQHHQFQTDQQQCSIPVGGDNGIDNPQLGDAIRFSDDASDVRWDFIEVIDSDGFVWSIRWQKKKLQFAGHAVAPTM